MLFIGAAAAAQSALEGFFKDALARFGLAAKEVEDFLVFWLPLMASQAWAEGLISIIVTDPANPYWLTEGQVAKATAESLGYTANVSAHKGDTNTESTLIDTAITNKSAAIILDPANADGSIGAVKKAIAANIPVFLVNAEINQEGLAKAQKPDDHGRRIGVFAKLQGDLLGQRIELHRRLVRPVGGRACPALGDFASQGLGIEGLGFVDMVHGAPAGAFPRA